MLNRFVSFLKVSNVRLPENYEGIKKTKEIKNQNQKVKRFARRNNLGNSQSKHYNVKVHIWDTSFLAREPGHVSLTLNADKNESLHFGFWPERELTPSDALQIFKAELKTNLDHEINCSPNEPAWKPSRQYEISINRKQYEDMKKEIKEYAQNIDSGIVRYTWCAPFKNMIGVFIYGSSNQRLENCATSTTKILHKGKINIKTGYAIWGITPSEVNRQLKNLIAQNAIIGKDVIVDNKKPRKEIVSFQQSSRHHKLNSGINLFNKPSNGSQEKSTGHNTNQSNDILNLNLTEKELDSQNASASPFK